jgi:class 3 adenylate cyclase
MRSETSRAAGCGVTRLEYLPLENSGADEFALVSGNEAGELRFPFTDRIEIGRLEAGAPACEGRVLVEDRTVSAFHCVIVRGPEGRLLVRDTSRNGTWLDDARLIPNREQEIRPGQALRVGPGIEFRLVSGATASHTTAADRRVTRGTVGRPTTQDLALLVGDVRGYTPLLTSVPEAELQAAVARVFTRLVTTIRSFGGQVKEYQGDSILAFWERWGEGSPAIPACRAALALQRHVQALAADGTSWPFPHHPLQMDWAVATGRVSVHVIGADRPEELSLVGEPVVLAYRLEKAADDRVGPLLTCARTRAEADGCFAFSDAGKLTLAGFNEPVRAFRLLGELHGPTGPSQTRESPAIRF